MDSKKKFPISNIGTASLLMIFIVLCMVIFALLSFTEANRDYKYSQAMAQHNSQYYEASNIAYEQIAEIDNALADGRDFRIIDGVAVTKVFDPKHPNYYTFSVSMNESQAIQVVLDLTKKGSAQVKSFAEVQSGQWQGDTSLNVFDGSLE